jgi:hypothetical protein
MKKSDEHIISVREVERTEGICVLNELGQSEAVVAASRDVLPVRSGLPSLGLHSRLIEEFKSVETSVF